MDPAPWRGNPGERAIVLFFWLERDRELIRRQRVHETLVAQNDAIRVMLDGNHQRLAVIDESGQLVGLLAKRTLLRSLAQLTL